MKICKCDCIPVSVDMKTGKVKCMKCGGIKSKPKGRAKMFSDAVKKLEGKK